MKQKSQIQSVHRHVSGLFIFLPRLFKAKAQIEKGDKVRLTIKGEKLIVEKLGAKEVDDEA